MTSLAEAEGRLRAIGNYGIVLGDQVTRIRCNIPGAGIFVRLLTRFRNWKEGTP